MEKGNVCITGMNLSGMEHSSRNMVYIAGGEGLFLPGYGHIDTSLEDESDLGCVTVLRQVSILSKFHEKYLVLFRLGQVGFEPVNGYVSLGKVFDGIWEKFAHMVLQISGPDMDAGTGPRGLIVWQKNFPPKIQGGPA